MELTDEDFLHLGMQVCLRLFDENEVDTCRCWRCLKLPEKFQQLKKDVYQVADA